MKFLFLIATLLIEVSLQSEENNQTELVERWGEFKHSNAKSYHSSTEETRRRLIWLGNHQYVKRINAANLGFKLALNKYGDLSQQEFLHKRTGLKVGRLDYVQPQRTRIIMMKRLATTYPTSFDWRNQSCVTPVKDQGVCGSCWSFSATGALECQLKKKHGQLISVSEQQFIDCDPYNAGCEGGWPAYALNYASNGVASEPVYPYSSITYNNGRPNSKCTFNSSSSVVRTASTSYGTVPDNNDQALMNAIVNVGTISAVVCVNLNFAYYSEGIYTDAACTDSNMNHAILVVGYGADAKTGVSYWIVKNSWGTSWGERGYMRIQRGMGLIRTPVYPVIY